MNKINSQKQLKQNKSQSQQKQKTKDSKRKNSDQSNLEKVMVDESMYQELQECKKQIKILTQILKIRLNEQNQEEGNQEELITLLSKTQVELEETKSNLDNLMKEQDLLKDQLKKATNSEKNSQQQTQRNEQEVLNLQSQLQYYMAVSEELQINIQKVNDLNFKTEEQNIMISQECEQVKQELSLFQNEFSELKNLMNISIEQMKFQNQQLNQEKEDLLIKLNESNQLIKNLQGQMQKISKHDQNSGKSNSRNQNELLQNQLEQAQKQYQKAQKKVQKLENEVKQLKDQNQKLQVESDEYKQQCEQLQRDLKEVNRKIEKMQKQKNKVRDFIEQQESKRSFYSEEQIIQQSPSKQQQKETMRQVRISDLEDEVDFSVLISECQNKINKMIQKS